MVTRRPSTLAKLSPPRLFVAVRRPRLLERLTSARAHPAVWVCGPPGSGKTTLTAQWVQECCRNAIWYHLDEGDADVSSLYAYLRDALHRRFPRRTALPFFAPENTQDGKSFARRFFRDFFGQLGPGATLVLDNWSTADSSAPLREAIAALIGEVPMDAVVVIASRDLPFPELAGCVANQSLVSLGWTDLRFTPAETAELLSGAESGVADVLHHRSDGWIAGIVLMREHLRREGGLPHSIDHTGSRELFDYFATEVFGSMSEQDREQLTRLAFLPVITPAVAESLLPGRDPVPLLERLYRGNLFVQKHLRTEPFYRFHALFRAFLREHARLALQPDEHRAVAAVSGALFERDGLSDQAFELYVSAGEFERAGALLLREAPVLFETGRSKTLVEWAGKIPVEVRAADPWLLYWIGVAEAQADLTRSRRTLSEAYDVFVLQSDSLGQMLSAAAVLTGFYFEYLDWTPADVWIERLADLVGRGVELPDVESRLSVYSALLYGFAIRQPEHSMLPGTIQHVLRLLSEPCDVNVRMQAGLAITGPVACMLGAFDLFRQVRTMLQPLLADPSLRDLYRASWHMTCGAKMSFDCDFTEAYAELEDGVRLSRRFGLKQIEFLSHHFEGLHAAFYFDADRAHRAFVSSRAVVDWGNPLQVAYAWWGCQAEAAIAGEGESALDHALRGKAVGDGIGSPAHRIIGAVFHSTALVRCARTDEAEAVVKEAKRFASLHQVGTWDAALEGVMAWSRLRQGDHRAARCHMRSALQAGRGGRWVYLRWLFEGAREILEFSLEQGLEVQDVQALLVRFRYKPTSYSLESWPWAVRVYTIDRFSIEVQGQPLVFPRKTPRRLLSLLQCIIARGGDDVPVHALMDDIWPDADGDDAHRRLTLALHRLRMLLGAADAIVLQGGKVCLNRDLVWVDVLSLLSADEADCCNDPGDADGLALADRFLASEPLEPWMAPMRHRLRRRVRSRVSVPVEGSDSRGEIGNR